MTDVSTSADQEKRTDTNAETSSQFWQVQLGLADKDQAEWEKDGQAVVDRYRMEKKRAGASRRSPKSFNILYSNTETLKSALYGRAAKPDVRRRFADRDQNARQAAEIIERSLIYCAEVYNVDRCITPALHDYLLPGRGVVRVEYEPILEQVQDPISQQSVEVITDQIVRERYVYWEDYRQNPARTFDDVWWVAFRHVMSRQDLIDNKFEGAQTEIPLNWSPNTTDKKPIPDDLKKAEVWEIWDKTKRQRVWVVKGYNKVLRSDDDPYGLEAFFPLPEPLVSVQDTKTLVPQPEYFEYRDQAEDLDEIVARISILTRALKRRGVYNKTVKELARLPSANDNQFIPVDDWAALQAKGGLKGAFESEDISQIAGVLQQLYLQRDMLVQSIYELTGIADIMRGSSDPNETFGAQQLKAQFGSSRIKRRQRTVQGWIRDIYRIKAELIAEHFEPQVLQVMTGIQVTPEIVALLRSDKLRGYRIDIETDSTVFEDEAAVKQQTSEALQAIGGFFREALPAVQANPELAPLAFEMVGMAARSLKRGRELEDLIEQTKNSIMEKVAAAKQNPPQPPPDPKAEADKAKAAAEMAKIPLEQEKLKAETQSAQADRDIKLIELSIRQQDQGAKAAVANDDAAHARELRERENKGKEARSQLEFDLDQGRRAEAFTAEQARRADLLAAESRTRSDNEIRLQNEDAERRRSMPAEPRKPRTVKFLKGEAGSIEGAEIH